jgi:hypothetical protein
MSAQKDFRLGNNPSSGERMENRKKAAAAAAVIDYITAEEEAKRNQAMASGQMMPVPAGIAAGPVRLWGVSGRQFQMQMRSMMQMRTFR